MVKAIEVEWGETWNRSWFLILWEETRRCISDRISGTSREPLRTDVINSRSASDQPIESKSMFKHEQMNDQSWCGCSIFNK